MRLARILVDGVPRYCQVEGDDCHVLGPGEPETARRDGSRTAVADADFLPPVIPTKILAVLGGFLKRRDPQLVRQTPPYFTSKLTSCVTSHGRPIVKPFDMPNGLNGEAELGVVLSRDIRRASPDEARSAILGFTCVNDMTLDQQDATGGDWVKPKSVDTFGPFGPWIETELSPDAVSAGIKIRAYVNDVQTQEGDTADFVWSVLETISWASQLFTMRRFDLISLGTPSPVSKVGVGDEMKVVIDGIGALVNRIVSEDP